MSDETRVVPVSLTFQSASVEFQRELCRSLVANAAALTEQIRSHVPSAAITDISEIPVHGARKPSAIISVTAALSIGIASSLMASWIYDALKSAQAYNQTVSTVIIGTVKVDLHAPTCLGDIEAMLGNLLKQTGPSKSSE
jgi:hypothetical protein